MTKTKEKDPTERMAELCEDGKWRERTERAEIMQARKLLAVFRSTANSRGFRIEGIKLEAMGSGNKY